MKKSLGFQVHLIRVIKFKTPKKLSFFGTGVFVLAFIVQDIPHPFLKAFSVKVSVF